MGQVTEIFQSVNIYPNYFYIYSKPRRDRPVVYAVERDTKMWQYYFCKILSQTKETSQRKKLKFSWILSFIFPELRFNFQNYRTWNPRAPLLCLSVVYLYICLSHLRSAEGTSNKKPSSVPRTSYVFNISRKKKENWQTVTFNSLLFHSFSNIIKIFKILIFFKKRTNTTDYKTGKKKNCNKQDRQKTRKEKKYKWKLMR